MSKQNLLVNLDAMIARADFAVTSEAGEHYENVPTISIRDFMKEGFIGPILRKPDFQRETNHWNPKQVFSLLKCFLDGELIPSVILWKSTTHLFVIDGGHRLSVLRAWVEDDYGDGSISQQFFGSAISKAQRKAAEQARTLVNDGIGSFTHFQEKIGGASSDARVLSVVTRGLPIQWVKGDADKAEESFFRINTQGTPLDEIEELLLRNRDKPIAISARSVIRAGKGHKYWSHFEHELYSRIEALARSLHEVLFDPEVASPIKTLDLPLGGSKGVRTALQVLIDYFKIACSNQTNTVVGIDYGGDDLTGHETIGVLEKALKLAQRITGNDRGSLGLHPAVYFYSPSGAHSIPMFLGTVSLIHERLRNNDKEFFRAFSKSREIIETTLVEHKDLIATILQRVVSKKRVNAFKVILESIYLSAKKGETPTPEQMVEWGGVAGRIVVGADAIVGSDISDDAKSRTFISTALQGIPKCPLCNGYIDVAKSVSYDHILRVREGGTGSAANVQITHPYCNQSLKN